MDPVAIAALRRSYELAGLDASDVDPDPMAQFARWLADVVAAEITEPNAMVLATADDSGQPRARTVLLKGVSAPPSEAGFVFYTNYHSTKAEHLRLNPHASLCFPWIELERQVIVEGIVSEVSAQESALYFRSRPRGSQLGALASRQSEVIASRDVLTERFAELSEQYPDDTEIPAPDFWGGYRLVPELIEFWQGRGNRLHDRIRYRRSSPDGSVGSAGAAAWTIERLAP